MAGRHSPQPRNPVLHCAPSANQTQSRPPSTLDSLADQTHAITAQASMAAACSLFHPHSGLHQNNQRSEEHTSELQSLMRISYAVFCLQKKKTLILPGINRLSTEV